MRHVIFFGGAKCSAEQVVSTALSSLFAVTNSAVGPSAPPMMPITAAFCASGMNGSPWRFALNRRIVLRAVLNGDEAFRRGRRDRIGHCGKSIRKIETRVGKSVFRQRLRLQILSRQRVRYAIMRKRKYVAGLLNFKLRAGHAHGLRGQRQRERRDAFRAALRLPRERIAVNRPAVFRV